MSRLMALPEDVAALSCYGEPVHCLASLDHELASFAGGASGAGRHFLAAGAVR